MSEVKMKLNDIERSIIDNIDQIRSDVLRIAFYLKEIDNMAEDYENEQK